MLKAIKNKKGSAIVWALLVLAMLSVLIATALTISFSYLQRSRVSTDVRQCYLTARSCAEAVAQQIIDGANLDKLLPDYTAGAANEITSAVGGFPAGKMGECTVTITRTGEDAATVSATVTRRDSSYTYAVKLAANTIIVPKFEGGVFLKQLSNAANTTAFKTVEGDVYIWGTGVNYIDFPVNGNVFAPDASVYVTELGGVSGAIFAQSVYYAADPPHLSERYAPTMCVTKTESAIDPGYDAQEGVDPALTEQHYLSSDGAVDNYQAVTDVFREANGDWYKSPETPWSISGPYDIPEAALTIDVIFGSVSVGGTRVFTHEFNLSGKYSITLDDSRNGSANDLFLFNIKDNVALDAFELTGKHADDDTVDFVIESGKTLDLAKGAAMTTDKKAGLILDSRLQFFGEQSTLNFSDDYDPITIADTYSTFNVGQITGPKNLITVKTTKTQQKVTVVKAGWQSLGGSEE